MASLLSFFLLLIVSNSHAADRISTVQWVQRNTQDQDQHDLFSMSLPPQVHRDFIAFIKRLF